MTRLLAVDWTYFFPDDPGWGWGCHEDADDAPLAWVVRAARMMGRMGEEALPGLLGDWSRFPSLFPLEATAQVYVAESAAAAWHPEVRSHGIAEVWSFSAYHDGGYRHGSRGAAPSPARTPRCDEWLGWYAATGAVCHLRYPRWKADAFDREPEAGMLYAGIDRDWATRGMRGDVLPAFGAVVVSRSGARVPPWHDAAFTAFANRWALRCGGRATVLAPPGAGLGDGGAEPAWWDATHPRRFRIREATVFGREDRRLGGDGMSDRAETERRVARRLLSEIDAEIVAVERMVLDGPRTAASRELEAEAALLGKMRAPLLRLLAKEGRGGAEQPTDG